MLPAATAAHYRAQQRLTVATLALTRRVWAEMGGGDFDKAWSDIGPRLEVVAVSGQLGAARGAEPYLTAVLPELGMDDDRAGDLVPESLIGVAGDGRPVDSLLYGAVVKARESAATGAGLQSSLEQGGWWLDMAVMTLLADTSRAAVSVGIAARPKVSGYVRMLNPPSCPRCTVLAGKWFRWNSGFLRHPRCDCRHIPANEDIAGDLRTDPRKAVESGNVRGLSKADAQAIADGADVSQVINAHRGMYTATTFGRTVKATREGTTSRGFAFSQLAGSGTVTQVTGTATRLTRTGPAERLVTQTRARVPRLRPESIYREAASREQAIALLKRFGYIT